ncbi:hypothetical protein B0H14DRAFT_3436584 [Mycena olivaceomarginata]|nr:hypothetical protein B0H14DRAFT_3436584 [Mycena olivaceomarginata]
MLTLDRIWTKGTTVDVAFVAIGLVPFVVPLAPGCYPLSLPIIGSLYCTGPPQATFSGSTLAINVFPN